MKKVPGLKKLVILAAVVCGTTVASGCRNYLTEGFSLRSAGVEASVSAPVSFHQNLEQEYLALADFMDSSARIKDSGRHFRDNAGRAARGEIVNPDPLSSHEIPAYAREDLAVARAQLAGALAESNTKRNAPLLAMAQVKFDCWLVYQNQFPTKDGFIGCREAFHQAMSFVSVDRKKPMQASPPRSEYEIAFEDDSAMLNPKAHEIVESVANYIAANPGTSVMMVGHSKAKVSESDTSNHAVRRTIAVRNALYQYGVDPDSVDVEFKNAGSPLSIELHIVSADGKSS